MSDTDDYSEALRRALGEEIRSWRRRRGLTRLQLAERADISETTMGRIERDGPVDVGDSWAIARALDIPFADLVRRAEEAARLASPMSDSPGSLPAVASEGELEDPGEDST